MPCRGLAGGSKHAGGSDQSMRRYGEVTDDLKAPGDGEGVEGDPARAGTGGLGAGGFRCRGVVGRGRGHRGDSGDSGGGGEWQRQGEAKNAQGVVHGEAPQWSDCRSLRVTRAFAERFWLHGWSAGRGAATARETPFIGQDIVPSVD